jgi:hypothetical protein
MGNKATITGIGKKTAPRWSLRRGAMLMDSIIGLLVLGFIAHPVWVEDYNDYGERTTRMEWELPMFQLLSYIDNFEGLIDQSWAGMDRAFGYTGPKMSELALPLMRETVQNGVVIMTAGLVDRQGHFSGNFNTAPRSYERASKAQAVAFYETARAGMAQYGR